MRFLKKFSIQEFSTKMLSSLAFRSSVYLLLFLCLMNFIALQAIKAQQQNTPLATEKLIPVHIGNLNNDGVQDTVLGFMNNRHQVFPRLILWGRLPEKDDSPHSPSAPQPAAGTARSTILHYPVWQFYGSSSIEEYNSNDTLDDILLHMWGTEIKGKDTLRQRKSLVIFGQPGLDTIAFIDVWNIAEAQRVPFFAMQLRKNNELTEPAVRDVSGALSYIVPRVIIPIIPDSSKHHLEEGITDIKGTNVIVYPNPAVLVAQVRASNVAPDNYSLDIFNAQGRLILSQSIKVDDSGEFLQALPVGELSSGYYLLRLVSKNGVVGAYPMLVLH